MRRLARALAILAWTLFLASLWLPAATVENAGVPGLEGEHAGRRHGVGASRSRWLAPVTLCTALYNAWAGRELDVTVQLGFYVWIAAFIVLTIALVMNPLAPREAQFAR